MTSDMTETAAERPGTPDPAAVPAARLRLELVFATIAFLVNYLRIFLLSALATYVLGIGGLLGKMMLGDGRDGASRAYFEWLARMEAPPAGAAEGVWPFAVYLAMAVGALVWTLRTAPGSGRGGRIRPTAVIALALAVVLTLATGVSLALGLFDRGAFGYLVGRALYGYGVGAALLGVGGAYLGAAALRALRARMFPEDGGGADRAAEVLGGEP